MGTQTIQHIELKNFDGIHIYPGPRGGWHADLSLKDLPTGIPDVMGSPKSMPCESRVEAIKFAKDLLMHMIAMIERRAGEAKDNEDKAVFLFGDVAMYVPTEALDHMKTIPGMPDKDSVKKKLEEWRNSFHGQELTVELLRGLSKDKRVELEVICGIALLAGIHRWPENPDMGPKGPFAH